MLSNKIVTLRQLKKEDSQILLRWLNNPQGIGIGHTFTPISEMKEDLWINKMTDQTDLKFFIIELTASNLAIGYISLTNINTVNRHAELELLLGEQEYQDKGFEAQALYLLLEYGFNSLNLNKITMRINSSFITGMQLAESLKFTEEGKLREDIFTDGSFHSTTIFSMLQKEWQEISRQDKSEQ